MKRLMTLILLCFVACKKVDIPPVNNGDPVFIVAATLEGDDLNLTAGENDYYLYTTYERDTQGVLSMIGTLRPENCIDCGPYLKMIIRELVASTTSSFDINDALPLGTYPFTGSVSDFEYHQMLQLNATPTIYQDDIVQSYTWTFDNELPDNFLANPLVEITDSMLSILVKLTTKTDAGCTSSIEKMIEFSGTGGGCSVGFDFGITFVQNQLHNQIMAAGSGNPPFTYQWSTGPVTPTILMINPQGSAFAEVCLTLDDAIGCQVTSCPSAKIFTSPAGDNEQYFCATDFTYDAFIDSVEISDAFQYGTVVIEYGDEAGTIFRSDLGNQLTDNFFTLDQIEDYDDNENDEKTKKLTFSTNIQLFDSNGVSKRLITNGSTFAIAHPD
ncbi:MAG: hypothetical protein DHS20C18_36040 [Saprospiraceae bacterium]|nr:MAG: hypothetical protein DHS20C18_36040 [Saprospiraceae bacterium]